MLPPPSSGFPLAAGLSGNKTSGSGADRKQEQEDREEGEAAAGADGLRIMAHVPRVEQRESQSQGAPGHAKIDQCLRAHPTHHSINRLRHRPLAALCMVPRRHMYSTWATLIVTAKLSSSTGFE